MCVQPPVGLLRALPVGADQPGGMPGLLFGGVADQQPQPSLDLVGEPDRDEALLSEFLELPKELLVDPDRSVCSRQPSSLGIGVGIALDTLA
jgi:hypothetical protein